MVANAYFTVANIDVNQMEIIFFIEILSNRWCTLRHVLNSTLHITLYNWAVTSKLLRINKKTPKMVFFRYLIVTRTQGIVKSRKKIDAQILGFNCRRLMSFWLSEWTNILRSITGLLHCLAGCAISWVSLMPKHSCSVSCRFRICRGMRGFFGRTKIRFNLLRIFFKVKCISVWDVKVNRTMLWQRTLHTAVEQETLGCSSITLEAK